MERATMDFPVTEENFDRAWAYVEENRRRSIVRKWVRRVASAVGNLIFFLLMCIAIFGYYRSVDGPNFQGFLRSLPVLPEIWYWLSELLFPPERALWMKIAAAAAVLYLVPFVPAALCGGLVRLCCHPKAKPVPEGTVLEQAHALHEETERLLHATKQRQLSGNTWYVVLFMLCAFGLLIAFMLKLAFAGESDLLMQVYQEMSVSYIFVVVIWAIYAALNHVLLQMMRLLYIIKLPEELGTGVKNHLLRSDPVRKAQLEEEDRILALAEEIRLRRIREREEMLQRPKKKK